MPLKNVWTLAEQILLPHHCSHIRRLVQIHGGDINQCFRIEADVGDFFIKLNTAERLDMFTAESQGLQALASTKTISCCTPLANGTIADHSYLLLEYLPLTSEGDWYDAGRQLALLHQSDVGDQFGFDHDTWCGTTRQLNTPTTDWAKFYSQQRILPRLEQLPALAKNSHQLLAIDHAIREKLDSHPVTPALLHGDLWSGNIGFALGGPVIFDPAVYIGDREVDLAMTRLFGEFPADFYRGYQMTYPLPAGWQQRLPLYQLYPLLNHAVMFGGSYIDQSNRLLNQLDLN